MRPLQELDEPLAKAWVRARLQPLMEDDDATEHLAKYVMLLVKGLTDDRAATEETAMGRLRGELDEFLQDSAEGFVRDLFGAHAAGKFRRRAHGPRSRSPQRRASARSEAPAPMEEEEVIVEGVAGSDARNGDDRAAMFEDEEANDYSDGSDRGRGSRRRGRRRRDSRSRSPPPPTSAPQDKRPRTESFGDRRRDAQRSRGGVRRRQGGGRDAPAGPSIYGPPPGGFPGGPMPPGRGPPPGPLHGGPFAGTAYGSFGGPPRDGAGFGGPPGGGMMQGYSPQRGPQLPPFLPLVPPGPPPIPPPPPLGPMELDLLKQKAGMRREGAPSFSPQERENGGRGAWGGLGVRRPAGGGPLGGSPGPPDAGGQAEPRMRREGAGGGARESGGQRERRSPRHQPQPPPQPRAPPQDIFTLRLVGVPEATDPAELIGHFRQFGIVVAAQVRALPFQHDAQGIRNTEAFVQMAELESAKQALTSPKAVLDNRFIRVMIGGHNLVAPDGPEAQAAVQAAQAAIAQREEVQARGARQVAKTAEIQKAQRHKAAIMAAQAATRKHMERTLEKRSLLQHLCAQLRDVGGDAEELQRTQAMLENSEREVVELSAGAEAEARTLQEAINRLLRLEVEAREIGAIIPNFQAVAKAAGIDLPAAGSAPAAPSQLGGGRGGRGRGRGRGGWAPPAAAAPGRGLIKRNLDLRTTCLLVAGVPADVEEPLLSMQFASHGQVDVMQRQPGAAPNGTVSFLVQYSDRRSAETARVRVKEYAGTPLTVSWHEGRLTVPGAATAAAAAAPTAAAAETSSAAEATGDPAAAAKALDAMSVDASSREVNGGTSAPAGAAAAAAPAADGSASEVSATSA